MNFQPDVNNLNDATDMDPAPLDLTVEDLKITELTKKLQHCQSKLYAAKRKIKSMQKKKVLSSLKKGKKIGDVLPGLNELQRTFIEILQENAKCKPQVNEKAHVFSKPIKLISRKMFCIQLHLSVSCQ